MSESENGTSRSTLRKVVWTVVAVLLAFAIVQSVTITPAIRGQIVDKQTGAPLPDAAIAALWELEIGTPAGVLPGGAVKVAETVSDRNGQFALETAVMLHWPVLPFSFLMRSERAMPILVVVKERYYAKIATNDIFGMEGPHHDSGFLSLRSSSLEDATIRLARLPDQPDPGAAREFEYRLADAASRVDSAALPCGLRSPCPNQSLSRTKEMLARSRRSLERDTN